MRNSLNLKRTGAGEKLVAIHGLGSASTAWELVKPELAKHFEVITIDLPGHGNSKLEATKGMKPEILAEMIVNELEDNGIDKFHLLGNSLGGWVSFEIAVKFPTKVLSITNLAPAGLWLVPETERRGNLLIARHLARATYKVSKLLLRFKLIKRFGFSRVSPQWEKLPLQTCVDATIAIGSAHGYFPLWDAFLGNRFDKEIDKKIPITIIFGDSDLTLPADNSQEKSLAPAHAKWLVLKNCGHAPMWDCPTEVIAETLETAKSVSN